MMEDPKTEHLFIGDYLILERDGNICIFHWIVDG